MQRPGLIDARRASKTTPLIRSGRPGEAIPLMVLTPLSSDRRLQQADGAAHLRSAPKRYNGLGQQPLPRGQAALQAASSQYPKPPTLFPAQESVASLRTTPHGPMRARKATQGDEARVCLAVESQPTFAECNRYTLLCYSSGTSV